MKFPRARMLVLAALIALPVLLAIVSQALAERPGAPQVDPNPVVVVVDPSRTPPSTTVRRSTAAPAAETPATTSPVGGAPRG